MEMASDPVGHLAISEDYPVADINNLEFGPKIVGILMTHCS